MPLRRSGDADTPAGPPRRRPRWGLRTLAFLGLALLSLITAASLGHYTVGTLGSLILGLGGAGYCTVKGLASAGDDRAFQLIRVIIGQRRRP